MCINSKSIFFNKKSQHNICPSKTKRTVLEAPGLGRSKAAEGADISTQTQYHWRTSIATHFKPKQNPITPQKKKQKKN